MDISPTVGDLVISTESCADRPHGIAIVPGMLGIILGATSYLDVGGVPCLRIYWLETELGHPVISHITRLFLEPFAADPDEEAT